MIFVIPSATTAPAPFNTMARSKSSKSSGTCCNLVMALLTLWSMVSLIVIVVWATSPHMKGLAQCNVAQQSLTEKMEGAKVVWEKEKQALLESIRLSQENQTTLQQEMEVVTERLRENSVSLSLSLQENAMLHVNETALRNAIFLHRETQRNMSLDLSLQREHFEWLQFNFTQAVHQSHSCSASCDASNSQAVAAMSQMKACESSKHYMMTQMERRGCKTNGLSSRAF
ncbi:uncharacterized protein isoform X2 [Salmo salar]|uniref:Uncharacterized protein isoform X2 n=1 Tax=Salmo salar TaxID=8030 RepID=A0A1S3R6Q4_SALSA|nr:uncharacterized protein LOC106600526 isoform X2 [Salmo salar]|eukprot:XP_014047424.1 PREDICTED: uncharacterized protein LOC106600526 [Salmo salar]